MFNLAQGTGFVTCVGVAVQRRRRKYTDQQDREPDRDRCPPVSDCAGDQVTIVELQHTNGTLTRPNCPVSPLLYSGVDENGMPRYFTLQEAESTLPHVEEAIRAAINLKAELANAEEALRSYTMRIMMSGGMLVDREQISKCKDMRDRGASRLQNAIDMVHEFGCLVKDLDIGLLDFPTLYHGREVYLCWKLGEDRITFWHGVDEGFRGRKQIDDEFLSNHRGDAVS